MKRIVSFIAVMCVTISLFAQNQPKYSEWFTKATMRVDYFHSGNATTDHFAIDRVLNDGEWAGSETVLLDELFRGLYYFEVYDHAGEEMIYSRGLASIFGEWQTTPEAKTEWGTYHESVRFPWPKNTVELVIKKRDAKNEFEEIFRKTIDPAARSTNPAVLDLGLDTYTYLESGDPNTKVDIVILGDGYTADEMDKFHSDVDRLVDEMFKVEPYKSRKNDFNIRAVDTPSATSGVNKPHPGVFNRSPLSMTYSFFDSERYAIATDNRTIRNVCAQVPYDAVYILINEATYGGGGIYNLYSTVCVDNAFSPYIFVHEFGHSFSGLADEYYSSAVSYEIADKVMAEPYEPNITANIDPETIKWKEGLTPNVPLPTPWDKEEFDAFSYEVQKERKKLRAAKVQESEVEALFARERKTMLEMIDKMEYKDVCGAFEGAGYMQYGLYRSGVDCIMYTRNKQEFCPACRLAINQTIDQYTR